MIRHLLVALSVLTLPAVRLFAADEPKAILDKAIKAHGGQTNLEKTLTGRVKAKATGTPVPGTDFSVIWEETFQLPTGYRRLIEGEMGGKKFKMEYGVVDGSGWVRKDDGPPRNFVGKKLPAESHWQASLVILPTLTGQDVKLDPLDKIKVKGSNAIGIKATVGEQTAELYFYEATGLLAKTRRRIQNPLLNKETDAEVTYSEYKDISGVQFPMRITSEVEGKPFMDVAITELKFLEKIDIESFKKP
jgi:hypothetical protein